jgi:hypothetical protein
VIIAIAAVCTASCCDRDGGVRRGVRPIRALGSQLRYGTGKCQAKRTSALTVLRHFAYPEPLAIRSFLPTIEENLQFVLLKRLTMLSSEAHEESTERDPETLYIDLVTTSAVQEQLSKLALLLATPPYLQSIKKVQDGVFAFKLTQEVVDLRTGILATVS